jgi:hypothetical protein
VHPRSVFWREGPGRRLGLLLIAAGLTAGRPAAAQEQWSVEVRTEPSAVHIGERDVSWWYNRMEVRYQAASKDMVYLAGETQTRDAVTNGMVILGGYARRGNWFYFAEGRAGIDPTFLYKASAEGQAGYLLHHTLVALDYRFLDYRATTVHLGTASATQSFPWGETEVRLAYGENTALGRPIRSAVVRALWFTTPRVWLGIGAAYGTRLFDAVAIELGQNEGWTAFANARWQWSDQDTLRVDFGVSHENPSFRQIGGAISYRRVF